jgi:hypothetical protein
LLLNALSRVVSVGFRSLKTLYIARTNAEAAMAGLENSNVLRLMSKEVTSCVRSRSVARDASCFPFEYAGNDVYVSPAGLYYGPMNAQYGHGHRLIHLMTHLFPNPFKTNHTVFQLRSGESVFALVDEAWLMRSSDHILGDSGARRAWYIPMGRQIGTRGETHICIWVQTTVSIVVDLITAYPVARASDCYDPD